MKLVSWNVNGLRAALTKGFEEFFRDADADVFCVQETKMRPEQAQIEFPGYLQYWNSADKKGYSGTAVFVKQKPDFVQYDFGEDEHRHEGRVITLGYERFYLVNAYSPNARAELQRIDYREKWEDDFREYVNALKAKKPVIVCGDLNVARTAIDLKNPKANEGSAGYSPQERGKLEQLLQSGFTDSFRYLYPEQTGAYTWWSYRFRARATNAGWRIDYFLVSNDIADQVKDSVIYAEVQGSDHCPVGLHIF